MFPPEQKNVELEEAVELLVQRPITSISWSPTGERLAVAWGPSTLAQQAGDGEEDDDDGALSLMLTECDGRDQHIRAVCVLALPSVALPLLRTQLHRHGTAKKKRKRESAARARLCERDMHILGSRLLIFFC